jgi:hypothetical protein
MRIESSHSQAIFNALIVATLTYALSDFYYLGDQQHYRHAYDVVGRYGIVDGFYIYWLITGSKEFIHYLFVWVFSSFADKIIFNTLLNAALAYAVTILLIRRGGHYLIVLLLVATNYYMFALYFSHERLKLAGIFISYSLIISSTVYSGLFAIISILTHVQSFLFYVGHVFKYFFGVLGKLIAKGKISIYVLLAVTVGGVASIVLFGHVASKLTHYYQIRDPLEIAKLGIFASLTFYYTKNLKETLYMFIPLILAALFVGAERINIVGYFIFIYFAIEYKKGLNAGVLATSVYFLITGILFVDRFITTGSGY